MVASLTFEDLAYSNSSSLRMISIFYTGCLYQDIVIFTTLVLRVRLGHFLVLAPSMTLRYCWMLYTIYIFCTDLVSMVTFP